MIESGRLVLRRLTPDDAEFMRELVNDPDWLRFIGDRDVHTREEARDYLLRGPIASYERNGFGLYAVELRERPGPIGICGLVKREGLEDVDLGFAFLPAHRSRGYAREAAVATLEHAWRDLGLERIVAIVSPGNDASIRLLEEVGMRYERDLRLPGETSDVRLYALPRPGPPAGG